MSNNETNCIQHHLQNKQSITQWSEAMISVDTICLIIIFFISLKVTKMVWHGDKFLPLMLYCLQISLLGQILYYIFQIHIVKTNADCGIQSTAFICIDNFIPILPELFLAIAVGLNVSKWVYFLLRIRSFISIENAL